MTDSMSEVVERLAKVINPLAFEEVGAPQNKGPVMQGYYAVICNKAREQARAVLTELSAMGLVVVPERTMPTWGADMEPGRLVIEFEKQLCALLGRPWQVTGISCETLLAEIKYRLTASPKVQP